VDVLSLQSADMAGGIDLLDGVLDQLTAPFDFQLTELVLVRVLVQDTDGMPMPYARVSWMDVLSLPEQGGSGGNGSAPALIDDVASVEVFGKAFADKTGALEISISIPIPRADLADLTITLSEDVGT
jgi:hypothetical protein